MRGFLILLVFSVFFSYPSIGADRLKGGSLVIGHTEVVSSGGSTVLTVGSNNYIDVTGTAVHTIVLPDAQTLGFADRSFQIVNSTNQDVTIELDDNSTLVVLKEDESAWLKCVDIATSNGVWSIVEIPSLVGAESDPLSLHLDGSTFMTAPISAVGDLTLSINSGANAGLLIEDETSVGDPATIALTCAGGDGDCAIGSADAGTTLKRPGIIHLKGGTASGDSGTYAALQTLLGFRVWSGVNMAGNNANTLALMGSPDGTPTANSIFSFLYADTLLQAGWRTMDGVGGFDQQDICVGTNSTVGGAFNDAICFLKDTNLSMRLGDIVMTGGGDLDSAGAITSLGGATGFDITPSTSGEFDVTDKSGAVVNFRLYTRDKDGSDQIGHQIVALESGSDRETFEIYYTPDLLSGAYFMGPFSEGAGEQRPWFLSNDSTLGLLKQTIVMNETVTDGGSGIIQISGDAGVDLELSGVTKFEVNSSDLLPGGDALMDLGSGSRRLKDIYASNSAIIGATTTYADSSISVSDDAAADANQAPALILNASDKVAGTGDGADIELNPGSSTGGSPGVIKLGGNLEFLDDGEIILTDPVESDIRIFHGGPNEGVITQSIDSNTPIYSGQETALNDRGDDNQYFYYAYRTGASAEALAMGFEADENPPGEFFISTISAGAGTSRKPLNIGWGHNDPAFRIEDGTTIEINRILRADDNSVADASSAPSLQLRGANKLAGTGDGGAIELTGGSSTGGSEGTINIHSSIVVDPAEKLTFVGSSSPSVTIENDPGLFGLKVVNNATGGGGAYHTFQTDPQDGTVDNQVYFEGRNQGGADTHYMGFGYNAFSSPPSYFIGATNRNGAASDPPFIIAYSEPTDGFPKAMLTMEDSSSVELTVGLLRGNDTTAPTAAQDITIRAGVCTGLGSCDGDLILGASGETGFILAENTLVALPGAVATPSITIQGDTNTGLYSGGDGVVNFSSNGTLSAAFASTGVRVTDGSESVPSYSFTADTSAGIYKFGTGIGITATGDVRATVTADGMNLIQPLSFDKQDVSLTSDDTAISVTSSLIELSSDSAVHTDRTFTLNAGVEGAALTIVFVSGSSFSAELLNTGTACLTSDWDPIQNDTLKLSYSTTLGCWAEVSRSGGGNVDGTENFSDTTQTTDGVATTIRSVVLANDDMVGIKFNCTAIENDGGKGAFVQIAVAYRKDGAAALTQVGTGTTGFSEADTPQPYGIDSDDDGTATVNLQVLGRAGETVEWKCKTEVQRQNATP